MSLSQQDKNIRYVDHFKYMAETNLEKVLQLESNLTRHVAYISLAMIVVSLLATDKLLTRYNCVLHKEALISSWVLCIVALMCMTVLVYQSSLFKDQLNNIYFAYLSQNHGTDYLSDEWDKATKKWKPHFLALSGIICVILALFALLTFIGLNIISFVH